MNISPPGRKFLEILHPYIESGRAFSWGHNSSGQLDFGNTENSNKPILIELNDVSIKNISCCHSHS